MSRARGGLLADRVFITALAIAVVVALGFGVVVPVLPLFARDFGVGLFEVTLVVSVFAAARLVSNIYTGALTDRVGMRTSICWGAAVVAVSSLLIAAAPNYGALLAFRGLGGFGSALFLNALLAFIVQAVPSSQRARAVGMLQGAFLFGISLGPSVGGLLAEPLGLRWPFVIYAAFCGAAGLVAYLFLPRAETLQGHGDALGAESPEGAMVANPRGFATIWRASRQLCTDRAFVAALVMMGASRWAATGLRFSLVPVFGAEEIGAGPLLVGLALTLAALTQLAVLWPAGKIADTFGRRRLAVPAYGGFAVVAATFGLAGTVPAFFVMMALYGAGTGFTSVTPPAIVGDVVTGRTGLAMGVLNTAGDLGIVLGPLVSGVLADAAGYGWAFGVSGALLVVAAVVAARMRETLGSRAPAGA